MTIAKPNLIYSFYSNLIMNFFIVTTHFKCIDFVLFIFVMISWLGMPELLNHGIQLTFLDLFSYAIPFTTFCFGCLFFMLILFQCYSYISLVKDSPHAVNISFNGNCVIWSILPATQKLNCRICIGISLSMTMCMWVTFSLLNEMKYPLFPYHLN